MSVKFSGNVQLRPDMFYKAGISKNGVSYVLVKVIASKPSPKETKFVTNFGAVLEFWGDKAQKFIELNLQQYDYITVLSGIIESRYNEFYHTTDYHFVAFEFERKDKRETPAPTLVDDAPQESVPDNNIPF